MKLSDETKELSFTVLLFIGCGFMVVLCIAILFGFYWMIGDFILKALSIIFNHK